MRNTKAGRVALKVLKIFGWIFFSIIALLILVAVAIQIPWVQNKIKQEAIGFVQNKIGTPVRLDHFSLSFPKKIVLEGLYLEDQDRDTLLYAGRIGVDTDLWNLTDNIIDLKKIEMENIVSDIHRSAEDSAFNFDYIVKAFVTDSVTTTDTAAAAWDFKLGQVDLERLRFTLNDSLSGNHIGLGLAQLNIDTEKFDLANGEVNLGEISLSGVRTKIVQTKIPETVPDSVEIVPEDSAAVAMNIGFRTISLKDIRADYDHQALSQVARIVLPEMNVEANLIDIKNQEINLAAVLINNALISFQQMEVIPKDTVDTVDPAVKTQNENQEPWKFNLARFDIGSSSIHYNNFNEKPATEGIDFNNLWLSSLNLKVRNVAYNPNETRATLNSFSFSERSGFKLRMMHGVFAMLKDSLAVDNFLISTPNSKIALQANAKYPSFDALQKDITSALFVAEVKSSTISLKDVGYLVPAAVHQLPPNFSRSSSIKFGGHISGTLDDLLIQRLHFQGLHNTSLFANGRVQHVMNPDAMYVNIHIDRFYTTRYDIVAVMPDSVIPPSIQIPQWLQLTGNIKGTLQTPDVEALLTSDYGTVALDAVADLNKGVKENYRGEVRINEFMLGKLLGQPDQIGRLDMVAAINGTGTTIEELNALLKVRVNRLDYSGYTYRDFRLDGSIKKYFFSGEALMRDENLNFVLTADLDYNNDVPHYRLDFDLKNADFKKLKLSPEPMRIKAELAVDLETPDFKRLNGNISLHDVGVFNGRKLYMVDSLLFASIDQERRSEITISSDILSGEFKGTINLFSLGEVLNRHFNQYFSLRDTTYDKPVDEQNFKFNLVIKNTDLITEVLVPELEPFVPGEISGEFNSAQNDLKLNVGLSKINYSGVAFDSISFKTVSDDESLDFTLALQNIAMDTLSIRTLRLAGNVMNDSIHTNLMILDSLGEEKYFLGGVFHSLEDAFQFSFLKNHIVLNYEKWEAPRYNTLQFTSHGLEPNNFFISKENERILLYKKNNNDSTLSVAFREVDLKNITSLVEGTTPISGFIDGELTLSSAASGSFETDLRVKQLGIFEKVWGDLALLLSKKSDGPSNFNLSLQGEHAEMKADGFYTSDADPVILVRANIPRIDLSILEPLTLGQVKDLKGVLRGRFSVQGKMANPDIAGSVNFNNASFISTYVNSLFVLPDETIFVRGDDFIFDRFKILDAKKNQLVIDGIVSAMEQSGFKLRLNIQSRDFQLMNTKEGDNDMIYGKVGVNMKASVNGSSNNPVVQMNVSLAEDSEVTYIVPQEEKVVMDQKGIVVFVDKDAKDDAFMKGIDPRDTLTNTFVGVDLTANIELSDTEKFNVIIDPVTGDRLEVQGNSTLTLHMDPSGEVQLSGRYEVSEGIYGLSFAKLVKREFQIEKGSTIVWSGDPLNAEMNMRAIYEVETAPVDLVVNQVTEAELPMYKKKVPFQVHLILKGELLFPEISFELDMPENDRDEFGGNIYAKLKDINTRESDLNKQVFALIILKRFISDNPLESQSGGSLASTARQSVSKILSDQLNRLSSNVKGVQLSFDLKSYEDYSSGSASNNTQLQLGVSKSMMDDRLVVKVAGNVNLEGEQAQQQNSLTDFVGDIALEYKLTEDGRFRVTGFRNSNFDLISGNLIQTGAGLIYIKDYDALLELFKANKKEK